MDYKEKVIALLNSQELSKEQKEKLEEMFPELKESEDERIKKEITELVMQPTWKTEKEFHRRKELCDWLEKQVEQDMGISEVTKQELKNNLNKALAVETGESWNEFLDEQKPADKVEPKFKVGDKIYLKPEYRMPDDDTPIANTVKEIIRIDDKHYRFDGSYIFIEDQDKYELVEQKPAWSEEDERNIKELLYLVEANYLSSEEPHDRLINWIESLKGRFTWKPSEEQMQILQYLCETSSHPNEKVIPTLESLYQDLKKLREE